DEINVATVGCGQQRAIVPIRRESRSACAVCQINEAGAIELEIVNGDVGGGHEVEARALPEITDRHVVVAPHRYLIVIACDGDRVIGGEGEEEGVVDATDEIH